MHAMEKYVAGYTLVLDTQKFRHVPQVQLLAFKGVYNESRIWCSWKHIPFGLGKPGKRYVYVYACICACVCVRVCVYTYNMNMYLYTLSLSFPPSLTHTRTGRSWHTTCQHSLMHCFEGRVHPFCEQFSWACNAHWRGMYTHTYVHTCMHAYIHTYIHTNKLTYIRKLHTCTCTYILHAYNNTYIHTCIHAYMHVCWHAGMHAYIIQTSIHDITYNHYTKKLHADITYSHTHIYTYIQTWIQTHIQTYIHTSITYRHYIQPYIQQYI